MQNHVLEYLDNTVQRVPDKVAFADEREALTFREVQEYNRAVASCLLKNGYTREPVAVLMERRPGTITAFFGVINAGCFYVPLDVDMPVKRMELILDTIRPRAMICSVETRKLTEDIRFDGEIFLYEEMQQTSVEEDSLRRVRERAIDTDPIYVVFTSGSTGVPKGVVACHRSVIDYIEQLSETLEFDETTVFGSQTPLYLDACLKELYPTIKFGAVTYLIPRQLFSFPVKLVEFLNTYKINTICWVVSALTMISSLGTLEKFVPKYLRTVAFGSEVFPKKQFELWRKALPQAQFVNLYGPTEGTGMCCYYKVERELSPEEAIPIGRPFKNTEIILLDETNCPAKDGDCGEICIRGTSLTMGYYNNPEKTAEVFVQNPLNTAYPELIYRTGDIGRWNEYGELVFVSRKDYQIKHMGHRIELGEIEAGVLGLENVQLCGCIYDEEKGKIALYYTGDKKKEVLLAELKEILPRYMMPHYVEHLVEIPLTPNGKIDRKQLKQRYVKSK